ncbi:MAG: hypothetical protein R8M45_05785, partial [Ghiorsea sp.]
SGIGFSRLNSQGERLRHLNIVGGFFVPLFHQLVGWVQEAFACWVSLDDQSTNLHSARLFSFSRGIRWEHQGASI